MGFGDPLEGFGLVLSFLLYIIKWFLRCILLPHDGPFGVLLRCEDGKTRTEE